MFTEKLLDDLQAEAGELGLRGATEVSRAVRAALMERKKVGKVPDDRTQTYWATGRVVEAGKATPLEGVSEVVGLATLSGIAHEVAKGFWGVMKAYGMERCLEPQIKAGRVNLARKGSAHFQAVACALDDGSPHAWVDLWVFTTEAAAEAHAAALKPGKIF